jgi:predicted membrane GTPase involved in stress response
MGDGASGDASKQRYNAEGFRHSVCHIEAQDELVEVTPASIRMRKKIPAANQRPKGRPE